MPFYDPYDSPLSGTNMFSNPAAWVEMGAGALAGAVPKKSTETTSTTASGQQHQTSSSDTESNLRSDSAQHAAGTSVTTPTMSPEATAFMNQLIAKMSNQGNVNLRPYQAQQAEGINRASNLQQQAAANIMASRGLATSPVSGTTAANIDAQRFGQQINLNQSIPLLQEQMQQQRQAQMMNLLSVLPRGSSTTSSQDQTGTSTQVGSSKTTGTSDTDYKTQSDSTKKTSQGGGLSGMFGGLASTLASLAPIFL